MKKKLLQQIKLTITTNFVSFFEYSQSQLDSLNEMTLNELRQFEIELNKHDRVNTNESR